MTTIYIVPNEDKLYTTLKNIRQTTPFLCQFPDTSAGTDAICRHIETLNDLRQYYSSKEPVILRTLFQVFDHAYYHVKPENATRIHNAFTTGFLRHLPADYQSQKEVLKRMGLIPLTQKNRNSFEIILQNMIENYADRQWKKQDENHALSYQLQMMILKMAELKSRNRTQQNWLAENAQKLAQQHKRLKPMAKEFKPAPRKIYSGKTTLPQVQQEPTLAYRMVLSR